MISKAACKNSHRGRNARVRRRLRRRGYRILQAFIYRLNNKGKERDTSGGSPSVDEHQALKGVGTGQLPAPQIKRTEAVGYGGNVVREEVAPEALTDSSEWVSACKHFYDRACRYYFLPNHFADHENKMVQGALPRWRAVQGRDGPYQKRFLITFITGLVMKRLEKEKGYSARETQFQAEALSKVLAAVE